VEKIFEWAERLSASYGNFREKTIENRRYKHAHLLPLIENLKGHGQFSVETKGHSMQGREIYLIRTGTGKTKLFLWSQMHGDEPTATSALFDLFNFLKQDKLFQEEIKTINQNLELFFVPMLNPDGAQVFKRRNAIDIDINRDALRLVSPEAKLLKQLGQEINPEYAFNLHDQEIYYSAGFSEYPATMSFLAPSFNYRKEIDAKRTKAMQQIILINNVLQKFIPNCTGRYSDDFMPNAFGDNMQLWGYSTILFESGGYYNDPEKQVARKMNFLSLLVSLYAIATETKLDYDVSDYFSIPENKKDKFHDVVIRNANLVISGIGYKMDIAIRNKEINSDNFSSFTTKSEIADIGDLSYSHGYQDIDAKGAVVCNDGLNPINLELNGLANFCLVSKEGKLQARVENGKVSNVHN
jgi:hypothetical protein